MGAVTMVARSPWHLICVAVLWLLGNTITTITADCDVMISGTTYQPSREGTYKLQERTCHGRNVYRHTVGQNYLYFLSTDGWKGWMVGSTECVNAGGLAVEDDAIRPELATKSWEEVFSGSWYFSRGVQVKCTGSLSTGAIAGIAVACLIVAIALIVLIICCCCTDKKHSNVVQAGDTPGGTRNRTSITTLHNDSPHYSPYPRGNYLGPGSHTRGYQTRPVQPPVPPAYTEYGPPPAYTSPVPPPSPPRQQTNNQNRRISGPAPPPPPPAEASYRPPSRPPAYQYTDPYSTAGSGAPPTVSE